MAEGTTASYNPETGERRDTTFQYQPVPTPDPYGIESMDRNALAQTLREHPIDDALKYISTSIQFQGQRGYQKAIQDGKTPA
jgi:hypothetical protein